MKSLQPDKVSIFTVFLPQMSTFQELCWRMLSIEEKKRVESLCGQQLKERYVLSHGVLRIFLSFFCQVSPHTIAFSENQYGKPYLLNNPSLYFNMSHSFDYAAYIFSLSHEVGIDIEWINCGIDVAKLVQDLLCPSECKRFYALSLPEQQHTFYELWTKKEAIVKAFGQGLSYPFKVIDAMKSSSKSYHTIHDSKFYYHPFLSFHNLVGAIAVKDHMPDAIGHMITHASHLENFFQPETYSLYSQ